MAAHSENPESLARDAGIADALLQPLAAIPTPGGPVLHMLRPGCALWPEEGRVGEVYFSETLPGHVKAWKRHTRQTQRFAVPVGLLTTTGQALPAGGPCRSCCWAGRSTTSCCAFLWACGTASPPWGPARP